MRIVLCVVAWAIPGVASAQDSNILFSVDTIERRMREGKFQITAQEGSRMEGDRTQHALLRFAPDALMEVKWGNAPKGGEAFNNQPRYEVAAYALQRLFLDERDYVVPPTILRMISARDSANVPNMSPTFDGAKSTLVTMQFWTVGVTSTNVFDPERAQRDTAYARHLGNANILTYLIKHGDANKGNVLVSDDTTNPRVFAVDNGVSFASQPSSRGNDWSRLRVKRVPRATIERLRKISDEELATALGVLAQFELRDGEYVPVPAGANLNRNRGVRRKDTMLQLGLTASEIAGVRERRNNLLRDVDAGKLQTF
jgi:hypothetical protein